MTRNGSNMTISKSCIFFNRTDFMSHFLLKLELKMKGEIKLGKTENKWICRKKCGCKPRVHICTLWFRNLNTSKYLGDKIMKLHSSETRMYVGGRGKIWNSSNKTSWTLLGHSLGTSWALPGHFLGTPWLLLLSGAN